MALIYFDGYDQYAAVPAATSTVPVSWVNGLDNITTVATDPSIYVPTSSARYHKILGESRVWRTQTGSAPAGAPGNNGIYTFTQTGNSPAYSGAAYGNRYGVHLDTQATLTVNKKIIIGYKTKVSCYSPYTPNAASPHLLAVFSTGAFTDINNGFGLVLEGSQVIVAPITNASYGYLVNRSGLTGTPLSFVGGSPVLGTTNFVWGTNNGNTATPPIPDLAYNTVEIELTVEGKLTCWINNLYVGSVQFTDPNRIALIRYLKIGLREQYLTASSAQWTSYGFLGITDVYCMNGLGTRNTTRLGKVKVVSRLPATDSAVQFTRPDTSNTNAEVAAQLPPAFSPSLIGVKEGDTDLYGAPAFDFTNEAIIATSITTTGYKTDPSGNDIAPVLSVSGTKYVGNTNVVPISASQMKTEQYIYEVNPKTGLPFTKSDLDATTFGVTVVAPATSS